MDEDTKKILTVISLFILGISVFIAVHMLSSCSFNVSMNHSSGQATDVIDTDQKSDADISPNIEMKTI